MDLNIGVIGSGLAGLSAARALIRRGLKPTILDAGETLNREIELVVNRMRQISPSQWSATDRNLIAQNKTIRQGGIPRKYVFGSDYIYAPAHSEVGLIGKGVKASTTLAKGGFGKAWGAAILPAAESDIADWPNAAKLLAPHYREVMNWLPLSACNDRLASAFPAYKPQFSSLKLTPQAQALWKDLESMEEPRLSFGQARLAVTLEGEKGCRYCGMCLSGCVYGSIFDPADDLDRLEAAGLIRYQSGWLVRTILERGRKCIVLAQRLRNGETTEFSFDRVFLAAGAISSTRIMLQSIEAFNVPIELKDSQKFLLPLFRRCPAPYVADQMNALAALFIELRLPELGENWMHMQVSAVNDMVLRRLHLQNSKLWNKLFAAVLQRVMIAWCSLHSNHSAALEAVLMRRNSGTALMIKHMKLERARENVRMAIRHLAHVAPRFRSFIIKAIVELSTPGASNHVGGSFPMCENLQTRFQTDVLGRPSGFERLHIVDSAVLPSIPATTMALLMMANADRIATAAPLQ